MKSKDYLSGNNVVGKVTAMHCEGRKVFDTKKQLAVVLQDLNLDD